MAYLDWSADYSIGVEIFDNEHKGLMAILNDLHAVLGSGHDRAEVERLCYRLMEHAIQHFRHEEMYFEDWAYPRRVEHANAHKNLRREIFALQSKLLANPAQEGGQALSIFLKEWLTRHILTDDREYGAFLREKGLR